MKNPASKILSATTRVWRPSLLVLACSMFLASCSTPPKPAEPDGSARVLVNDPTRIVAIQRQAAQDRATLTENNYLRAELQALRDQVDEMKNVIRSTIALPKPTQAQPAASPQPVAPTPVYPARTSQVAPVTPAVSTAKIPDKSYEVVPGGSVVRVFHAFGRTDFAPSDDVAAILIDTAKTAQSIRIKGLTDNIGVSAANQETARLRALNAWSWLVARGVSPNIILTRFHTVGHTLASNDSADGRALNRRTEIEFQGPSVRTFVFSDKPNSSSL